MSASLFSPASLQLQTPERTSTALAPLLIAAGSFRGLRPTVVHPTGPNDMSVSINAWALTRMVAAGRLRAPDPLTGVLRARMLHSGELRLERLLLPAQAQHRGEQRLLEHTASQYRIIAHPDSPPYPVPGEVRDLISRGADGLACSVFVGLRGGRTNLRAMLAWPDANGAVHLTHPLVVRVACSTHELTELALHRLALKLTRLTA
jgi:hypothetical protein